MNLTKPFFILAPMDDVTDTVFRQIVADCAKPDLFFTEFVNVDGLQSPGRPHLLPKLLLTDKEKPVIAQVWGLKPDNYYKTTQELKNMGFAGVDINMGCPAKTVVKNGACSALINNKPLAGEIIDAVREAAGSDFPVSVKTRVGFTSVDMSWPEFLLSKKLNMLSIHGRTRAEMSKVPANWELIGEIVKMRDALCPSTLIVGNGDVRNRQHGLELIEKYNLDGVMIGRGIFDDPFVFAERSPWSGWTKDQKLNLFKKHIELHVETYKNRERRFETLRKFCKVYN
ncbi:MAG TPA: tRNA-dihydrouridine synthase [Candidatus Saccharimonadales bacterium]|nr:tRNA-dihydrouridine synthase [Candidatus Saccharimonadales bacterium]